MVEHFKKTRLSCMPNYWTIPSIWPDTRALFTALRTWMSMSKGGFRVCKNTVVMSKQGNNAAGMSVCVKASSRRSLLQIGGANISSKSKQMCGANLPRMRELVDRVLAWGLQDRSNSLQEWLLHWSQPLRCSQWERNGSEICHCKERTPQIIGKVIASAINGTTMETTQIIEWSDKSNLILLQDIVFIWNIMQWKSPATSESYLYERATIWIPREWKIVTDSAKVHDTNMISHFLCMSSIHCLSPIFVFLPSTMSDDLHSSQTKAPPRSTATDRFKPSACFVVALTTCYDFAGSAWKTWRGDQRLMLQVTWD